MHPSRRRFLASAPVAAVAAAAVAANPLAAGETGAATPPAAVSVVAGPPPGAAYVFLRPDEAVFVEALALHMVPADELSPDGVAIGIPVYVDRALASAWGAGDHLYTQGPFAEGDPNQGYQLPLTPAQLFRTGTAAFDDWTLLEFGARFHALDGGRREQALQRLQSASAGWAASVSQDWYFRLLYDLVVEGLFADPIHGGNRDKAGWRLVGYPGAVDFDARTRQRHREVPYLAEPLGIADLQAGRGGQ